MKPTFEIIKLAAKDCLKHWKIFVIFSILIRLLFSLLLQLLQSISSSPIWDVVFYTLLRMVAHNEDLATLSASSVLASVGNFFDSVRPYPLICHFAGNLVPTPTKSQQISSLYEGLASISRSLYSVFPPMGPRERAHLHAVHTLSFFMSISANSRSYDLHTRLHRTMSINWRITFRCLSRPFTHLDVCL